MSPRSDPPSGAWSPDGTTPRGAPRPCSWLLRVASGGLVCEAHPVDTLPWSRPRDCALPVATACHLCGREAVAIRSRFSWTFACPTCRRIDRALALPYGARSMTPLEGQDGENRGTMFERVHPDLADRTHRTESTSTGRLVVSITDDVPASATGLVRLRRFRVERLVAMASALDPEPVGPFVNWARWQQAFPASAAASAAAYQEFVRTAHPWIDSVEPRVADLEWLITLATGAPREDGRGTP